MNYFGIRAKTTLALSSLTLSSIAVAASGVHLNGPDVSFYGTTDDDEMIVKVANACDVQSNEYQFKLNGVILGCYPIERNLTVDGMPGEDLIAIRDGVVVPGNLGMVGGLHDDILRVGNTPTIEETDNDENAVSSSLLVLPSHCASVPMIPYDVLLDEIFPCVIVGGALTLSAGPNNNLMTIDNTLIGGDLDVFDGNHDGILRMRNSEVNGKSAVSMFKGNDVVRIEETYFFDKVAIANNTGEDFTRVDYSVFNGDLTHRDGSNSDKSVYCNTDVVGEFTYQGDGGDDVLASGYSGTSLQQNLAGTANGNSGRDKFKGDISNLTLLGFEIEKPAAPECDLESNV